MLINDFNGSDLVKYKKASRMLESIYGIKLAKSNDLNKLHESMNNANKIISNLKTKSKAINDREVIKYTLISEALQDLINFENKTRLDEIDAGYNDSPQYRQIISWLGDFCNKCLSVGDSIDDSVYDAMKQYRSSKYRFPDLQVELDLREYLEELIENQYTKSTNLLDDMPLEETNKRTQKARWQR
jgi:hypothetical protein